MKIKGHARIELTDVNTGAVEAHEYDNLVTDFATALFKPLGLLNTFGLSDITADTPYENFFGGILCLDGALTEDASEYYLPASVGMTANGAIDVSNSTDVTEMGSYNATESGLSEDGKSFTFVYDWTTSQGNGTIACVCLTNPAYGYIGAGNGTSAVRHSTRENLSAYGGTPTAQLVSGSSAQRSGELAWLDAVNNKVGIFRSNLYEQIRNSEIIVDVYRYPISEVAPMRSISMNAYTASNLELLETLTYTLSGDQPTSSSVLSATYTKIAYMEDKTAISIQSASNATHYEYIIEIKPDGTLNEWRTNSVTWGDFTKSALTYTDDYLVRLNVSGPSSVYVDVYDRTDGTVTNNTITQYNNYTYLTAINDRIIGNGWEVDASGNVLLTNGIYSASQYHNVAGCAYGDPDTLIAVSTYGDSTSTGANYLTRFYRNGAWISTINNLDEVVTKDNTKTMKITYTITEAE